MSVQALQGPDLSRARSLGYAAAFLILTSLAAIVSIFITPDGTLVVDVVGVLLAIVLAAAARIRTGRLLNGLTLFLPLYTLNFFIYGIYVVAVPFRAGRLAVDLTGQHFTASLLALVGLICVGTAFFASPLRRSLRDEQTAADFTTFFWISLVVGWSARAYIVANGWNVGSLARFLEIPTAASLVAFPAFLATFALFLMASNRRFHPERVTGQRWIYWVLILGEMGWGLLTASKAALVPAVLAVAFGGIGLRASPAPGAQGGRRTRLSTVSSGLLVILMVVILVPAIAGIRSSVSPYEAGSTSVTGLLANRGRIEQSVVEDAALGNTGLIQFLERTSGLLSLSAIVKGLSQGSESYLGSASLLTIFDQLVPSVLWPTKTASVTMIADRTSTLYGFGPSYHSGLSVTLPGEFYWSYGISGLILGMLLLGHLLARLDRRIRDTRGDRAAVTLLLGSWAILATELWLEHVVSQVIKQLLVVVIVRWIVVHIFAPQTSRR